MQKKIAQFEIEDYSELTDEQLDKKIMVIGFKIMKLQMEKVVTEDLQDLEKMQQFVNLRVQLLDITKLIKKRIDDNEQQGN